MLLPLPLASYGLRSIPASTSRLVNCFAEAVPESKSNPVILTRAPGLTSWATVGTGPIKGMHAAHGVLYVVSDDDLYSVTSGGTATSRGDIGDASDEIDMDSNDTSVVVVNPPDAYYFTPSGPTFGQITDTDFTSRGAGDVEFLDNYMLFREPDSGRFFGADLGSVTDFDALNFATAEGHPDTMVGFKVDHRNALLFGEKSLEMWENTGVAGFPFQRMINGFVEQGCINGRTVAKVDQSVFWVADDYTVRRLEGATPRRVSTHAVEQWLRGVTLLSLRGYSYSQEGHIFYVLTAPEGAFFYDATTQQWSERLTDGETTWDWAHPVAFAGKILVGSTTSNVIAELDPETYSELGSPQVMEWAYQPVFTEGVRAFHDRLEMVMEVGQGASAEVALEFSDDGGNTWVTMPSKSLGASAAYTTRVVWSALGSCASPFGRVYRASVSAAVKVTVMNTLLEVRGGRL